MPSTAAAPATASRAPARTPPPGSPRPAPRRRRRRPARAAPAALSLALIAAPGCAEAPDGIYAPSPMPLHVRADLAARHADQPWAPLGFAADAAVAVEVRHRGDPATVGCTASLDVELARADGSCRLQLHFAPTAASPDLRLHGVELVGRGAGVPDCAALQGALPADATSVRWTLATGHAELPLPPPPPGTGETWPLDKLALLPHGTVQLAAVGGGEPLELRLDGALIGGDVISHAAAVGSCMPCPVGGACRSALPPHRLRDFQLESPTLDLRPPLEVWRGAPLALISTQGW